MAYHSDLSRRQSRTNLEKLRLRSRQGPLDSMVNEMAKGRRTSSVYCTHAGDCPSMKDLESILGGIVSVWRRARCKKETYRVLSLDIKLKVYSSGSCSRYTKLRRRLLVYADALVRSLVGSQGQRSQFPISCNSKILHYQAGCVPQETASATVLLERLYEPSAVLTEALTQR